MEDKFQLYHGDCLEVMQQIPNKSVDVVLADLPYGITDCKWDSIIPLDRMWAQYNRLVKDNGVIVLFASQPFTTKLINSNFKDFKYCWYWVKTGATGHAFAKKQPMRRVEEICVFYRSATEYIGQSEIFEPLRKYLTEERQKTGLRAKEIDALLENSMANHYFTNGVQWSLPTETAYKKLQTTGRFNRSYESIKAEYKELLGKRDRPTVDVRYYPQGVVKLDVPLVRSKNRHREDSIYRPGLYTKEYKQEYTGYPDNVLKFSNNGGDLSVNKRFHPTQKPVELLEYLIKTYTAEGETVLDNTMGSGSTGVAAINTGRLFIGIEKDDKYFKIAKRRIEGAVNEGSMSVVCQ